MRKKVVFLTALVLAISLAHAATMDQYQKLAYQIKPAVIRVVSVVFIQYSYVDANNVRRSGDIALGGTGSGFIFNNEGYIVTNGHVIYHVYWYENNPTTYVNNVMPILVAQLMKREGVVQIDDAARTRWQGNRDFSVTNHKTFKKVILSNGEMVDFEIKRYSASIDEGGKDVGILKIERTNLPVVMIGDSSKVEIQEEIQTFGFPGAADLNGIMGFYLNPRSSLQVTINRGRISSKKQDYKGVPLIQTDAAIAHGSSGGPVINQKGEVIGVTTYMGGEVGPDGQFTPVQGINFLIPINTVKEFIRDVGVEVNLGSRFNDIYYSALDYVWNEDWFKADEKVDAAMSLLNDSPDLKELKEKITIEITGMSALEKLWKQNRIVLIVVLIIAILVILFVLLLLRSKRKDVALEKEMEVKKKEILADKAAPMPPPSTASEAKGDDKTMILFGNIDLIINEKKEGRYPVTEQPLLVGRDPTRANILVQDPIVSKVHCTIYVKDNAVYIKDNDSTNGTFIGDKKITEELLNDNDLVLIGRKGSIKLMFLK